MRPNNDIVEFHIILQNYQLVFEILPNGNVNLIEKVIKNIAYLSYRPIYRVCNDLNFNFLA